MSRVNQKDTKPEVELRRLLHARGMRYRVTFPVPGYPRRTIDVAFTRAKVAVFIDGCFWHSCPVHATQPRANSEWWKTKLATNVARDAETSEALENHGWVVLRFWEHQEPFLVADMVQEVVRTRAPTPPRAGGRSGLTELGPAAPRPRTAMASTTSLLGRHAEPVKSGETVFT